MIILLFFLILFAFPFELTIDGSSYNTIISNNITRYFLVYIPDGIKNSQDKDASYTALFGFHGAGGNAKNFFNYYGFKDVADSENFIFIIPEGVCSGDNTICYWNTGSEILVDSDDLLFVDDLTDFLLSDSLMENVKIDPLKIYFTGHSNGAFMSYYYAINNKWDGISRKLVGIAPLAGQHRGYVYNDILYCIDSTLPYGINLLHVHGTLDDLVPIERGLCLNQYPCIGMNDSITCWLGFDSCTPDSIQEDHTTVSYDMDNTMIRSYYSTCTNSVIASIEMKDSGHLLNDYLGEFTSGKTKNGWCEHYSTFSEMVWKELILLENIEPEDDTDDGDDDDTDDDDENDDNYDSKGFFFSFFMFTIFAIGTIII